MAWANGRSPAPSPYPRLEEVDHPTSPDVFHLAKNAKPPPRRPTPVEHEDLPSPVRRRVASDVNQLDAAEKGRSSSKKRRVKVLEEEEIFTPEYAPLARPIFIMLALAACSAIMIWEFAENSWKAEPLSVNPFYGVSMDAMVTCGAKSTDLIIDRHQVWRLISATFVHAGLIHFFACLLAIAMLGIPLERGFGTWRIANIFCASAIFGTTVSATLLPNQVTVGSTGAIFGLIGATLADIGMNWTAYVGTPRWRIICLMVVIAGVFAIMGLTMYIDNLANIAGFVMGVMLGFSLLTDPYGGEPDAKLGPPRRRILKTLGTSAALGLMAWALVELFFVHGSSSSAVDCAWCQDISCVPFPSQGNSWWTCTD